MSPNLLKIVLCVCLFVTAATAQKKSWDDIKPLDEANRANAGGVDYAPLVERLAEMQTVVRQPAETLFTGERLIFDFAAQLVQMEQNVVVRDDRGVLKADLLKGRFTDDRKVEKIDAEGNVEVVSEQRKAMAERASYTFETGVVELNGAAQVMDLETSNRLSAGQITFWTKGSRKVVCRPDAQMVIASLKGLKEGDSDELALSGSTEIRADELVYDEAQQQVVLDGNVWVKNEQATLDAGRAIVHLIGTNAVDFVEAQDDIYINSEGRTAKAERAVYRYADGEVTMEGRAKLSASGNELTGEWVRFWIKEGNRRMLCKPNAKLVVANTEGGDMQGLPKADGATEIRALELMVDETLQRAELTGNVRVRDARGGMNCEKVIIYLKESNEIDWMEAVNEVIIQSGGRKAIADRAEYRMDEGKFVLEGSPKLKEGQNIMTADRITFWQETGQMICEPNVRALLYPSEDLKARFLKDLEE